MYLLHLLYLLCTFCNNTIVKLFSSILSSLKLIRWPYGCARNERINREWRKGVIVCTNWPDHFPSGATRRSFACCERRSDRGKERASCETHTNDYVRRSARQVRPVLIAIAQQPNDFETNRFGRPVLRFWRQKNNEREVYKGEGRNLITYLTPARVRASEGYLRMKSLRVLIKTAN